MITSIQNILKELSDSITKKNCAVEGLDLSYVDIKESHLEIFTYSTPEYETAVQSGLKNNNLGSLLLSKYTFNKKEPVIFENKFLIIPNSIEKKEKRVLEFKEFSTYFKGKNCATHQNWIKHYKQHKINGVYFFIGRRKCDDFDLVLFGVVNNEDKKNIKKIIRPIIKKFFEELNDFAIVFENLRHNKKSVVEQATRAAISQVMARNTSHNIGAHVMNKLIGELNYDTLFKKKNYGSTELTTLYSETINKWKNEREKDKKPTLTDEEQNQKILLDQISIFNNYVKCRMDYLADISFGTPVMQTNKYAYEELFTELDKVRLLLEHISGLDNWSFKIEFKKNGEPLSNEEDLLVAIPNDILGMQALYNILENIIRNTAKHTNKQVKKDETGNDIPTIFTVNFIDDINGDSNYCNDKSCDRSICKKAHKTEIENALKEFIAVEIYNDIPESNIDELVKNLNQKLNDDILHENKLRSSALGLIEMDASAAYLRKRPVEYINHPSYEIQYDESWSRNTERNGNNQDIRGTNCRHFLKAFKKTVTKEGNTENYLGYRIFLHRPAVVLVVTGQLKGNKDLRDILQKKGILVLEPNDFRKQLKDGKVFPHEFVVIDKEVKFEKINEEDFFEYYKTSLSIRILMIEANNNINDLFEKELECWEKFCWEKWGEKLLKEKKISIATSSSCKNDNCQCAIEENTFNAVILDHGKDEYLKYKNCKNIQYLDDLSTKAFEKLPQIKNLSANKWACYKNRLSHNSIQNFKIYESILSKILVIDERVQNQINETYHDGILFQEFYSRMGIIIPEIPKNSSFEDNDDFKMQKFNLAANDLRISGKSLIQYITKYSEKFKKNDSILIHYGILERVYNNESDKTKQINVFLNRISTDEGPQIIITSGRGGGALKDLTPKVRFVNLSSVITSFVEIKSKYFSNYLLKSARKNNSKN